MSRRFACAFAALGRGRFAASKAVVVRITLAEAAQRVVVDDTVHTVQIGSHWRWVLPMQRVAEYRAGICPDGIQA